MKEYRIVRNEYNGKGDYTFNTYKELFKALKILGRLELFMDRGTARIEEREVSDWSYSGFEVKAYDKK